MKNVNMKSISRKLAIRDGAYDGRFTTKKDVNRKKEEYKKHRKDKYKLRYEY